MDDPETELADARKRIDHLEKHCRSLEDRVTFVETRIPLRIAERLVRVEEESADRQERTTT